MLNHVRADNNAVGERSPSTAVELATLVQIDWKPSFCRKIILQALVCLGMIKSNGLNFPAHPEQFRSRAATYVNNLPPAFETRKRFRDFVNVRLPHETIARFCEVIEESDSISTAIVDRQEEIAKLLFAKFKTHTQTLALLRRSL